MGIFAAIQKRLRRRPKLWDGPITFDDVKFRVGPPRLRELPWLAVERISVYKVDLLVVDEIRVQFDHPGGSVVVTEESPGFPVFMHEVARRFPMAADWYTAVSQPAFAACETTLYEKLHV